MTRVMRWSRGVLLGVWILAVIAIGVAVTSRMPQRFHAEWQLRGLVEDGHSTRAEWDSIIGRELEATAELEVLAWDCLPTWKAPGEYRLSLSFHKRDVQATPAEDERAIRHFVDRLGTALAQQVRAARSARTRMQPPSNILHAKGEENPVDSTNPTLAAATGKPTLDMAAAGKLGFSPIAALSEVPVVQQVMYADPGDKGSAASPEQTGPSQSADHLTPLEKDRLQLRELEAKQEALREQDGPGGSNSQAAAAEAALRQQLVELESRRALLSAVMTPKHPTLRTLQRTIESTRIQWQLERDRLRAAHDQSIDRLDARMAMLRSRIDLQQRQHDLERQSGPTQSFPKKNGTQTPVPQVIEIEQVVPPTADSISLVQIAAWMALLGLLLFLAVVLIAKMLKRPPPPPVKEIDVPVLGHIPRGSEGPPVHFRLTSR